MYAVSHGLQSEPHSSFTAVLPNPPRNLTVGDVEDNVITLTWLPPVNSLYTEYQIRYRAYGDPTVEKAWNEITSVAPDTTTYKLTDLPPGESCYDAHSA